MKKSRYIIGIDLGTTNSSLSYIDTGGGTAIRAFAVPQLAGEGVVKELKALPSFLYIPGEYELPPGTISLPWDRDIDYIVGEFARIQGTRVPAHLVSSAKSWLCHNRADREGPILPRNMEPPEKRVSPVEASARYLRHMKDAWNYTMARGAEDSLLENQQVIITIPASFDESARELTARAADMAGIREFTMLEEPQAAFYAWIASHKDGLEELTGEHRLILVFDVGGGTTDFTLISVTGGKDGPSFRRVAVGDHIMLGGDNMDLALARRVETALAGPSGRFDFQQWLSATCQCRAAKEELLGGAGKESAVITVLGSGRRVVGGAGSVELTAREVRDIIIEGFFRKVDPREEVMKARVSGLQELGLPFVQDTAIMKHLSSFLRRHAANRELQRFICGKNGTRIVSPDILLFNGGVFSSPVIREHAASVIREWFPGEGRTLTVLENEEFDQAVSIGAAYYGLVLRGKGRRISGGIGKAYYIAVETRTEKQRAGAENLLTLVCIVPRGVEEGQEIHLSSPEFEVMTNSPVSFVLYSSSYRAGDRTGDVITAERDEFVELPPVRTVLHYGRKSGSVKIPVSLGIRLNEFGTLDVWCESRKTPHRWKLAFQLRGEPEEEKPPLHKKGPGHTLEESAVTGAADLIEKAFQHPPDKPAEVTPENVVKKIQELLNLDRKAWPLFAIRKMWDSLIKLRHARRLTPVHEARWLGLSGFLLRPGFGHGLDGVRIKELWKVFLEGLHFPRNGQCRTEWWIMWRRTAGGFDGAKQDIIFRKIAPWLLPSKKKPRRLSGAETAEMWMLAASLENLSPEIKEKLGDELAGDMKKSKGRVPEHYYWALSRLGARVPFHGPLDKVVSREAAERWIKVILDAEWAKPKNAAYAVAQMARKTDDRIRDIDRDLSARIAERLSPYKWSGRFIRQIEEVVPIEWEDEKDIFGESLPVGLYIVPPGFSGEQEAGG